MFVLGSKLVIILAGSNVTIKGYMAYHCHIGNAPLFTTDGEKDLEPVTRLPMETRSIPIAVDRLMRMWHFRDGLEVDSSAY